MARTPASPIINDRPVGVAVLSAIRHASYIVPALVVNPNVKLIAIGDEPTVQERWRDRGPKMAAEYGVPFVEDVDALLDRSDVDAVVLTSDYVRHGRLALKVLAAGKHLYLDKPMATSIEECRAIAEAATRNAREGLKTMTFSRYNNPSIERARTLIQAGRIGLVRAIHCEYTASYGPGEKYDPVQDEFGVHPRWTGGGEMMNFALYPLTSVRYLTGQQIETVHCFGGAYFNRAHRELGIDDMAHIVMQLSHGVIASVVVGRYHAPLHPGRGDVRSDVIGTTGRVTADEEKPAIDVYGVPSVGVDSQTYRSDYIAEQITRFIHYLRSGNEPGQSIVDSLRVMEASFASEESLKTGQVIRLVA